MSDVRNNYVIIIIYYIALFCPHYQLFINPTLSLRLSKPLPAFKTLENVKGLMEMFIREEQERNYAM